MKLCSNCLGPEFERTLADLGLDVSRLSRNATTSVDRPQIQWSPSPPVRPPPPDPLDPDRSPLGAPSIRVRDPDVRPIVAALPHGGLLADRPAWGTPQVRVALSSLVTAIGMLLIAVSYTASRSVSGWAEPLFWFGFVLIISPALISITSSMPGRGERQAILVVLALGLYAAKVFYSPTFFSFPDELQHLRSTEDLMATGRLFAPNPILPVSPLYPGFESVISAVVSVSGLSIFQAGILVVGMAKLLGVLALFALYELLSGSSRIASVGVLLYASNPHYALFDSQFAYESLGVPLIAFALFAICRRTGVPTDGRWTLLLICLLGILAVVVTHHVSSLFLLVILATWSIVSVLDRSWERQFGLLFAFTMFTLAAIVLWTTVVAFGAVAYLVNPLLSGIENLANLISGEAAARQLFEFFPGSAALDTNRGHRLSGPDRAGLANRPSTDLAGRWDERPGGNACAAREQLPLRAGIAVQLGDLDVGEVEHRHTSSWESDSLRHWRRHPSGQ